MLVKGSCYCKRVTFSATSFYPTPFNRCYCDICRKTQGGGGYAVTIAVQSDSLVVDGKENVACYHATMDTGEKEHNKRYFCKVCSSALWIFSDLWPEMTYPFASSIDSDIPPPPQKFHIMQNYKPEWVVLNRGPEDRLFDRYPDESVANWHKRLGRVSEGEKNEA